MIGYKEHELKRVYLEAHLDPKQLRKTLGADMSAYGSVASAVESEFDGWLSGSGLSAIRCNVVPEMTNAPGKNVLQTGMRFAAKTGLSDNVQYAFIGFDLVYSANGVGCRYIILQNLTDLSYTRVEAAWFCTALTERETNTVYHGKILVLDVGHNGKNTKMEHFPKIVSNAFQRLPLPLIFTTWRGMNGCLCIANTRRNSDVSLGNTRSIAGETSAGGAWCKDTTTAKISLPKIALYGFAMSVLCFNPKAEWGRELSVSHKPVCPLWEKTL